MRKTTETTAVINDLRNKCEMFYNQWRQFETQIIKASALSLGLPSPKGLAASQLQENLARIQTDIQTLKSKKETDISRSFIDNLRKKERAYQKALRPDGGNLLRANVMGMPLSGLVPIMIGGLLFICGLLIFSLFVIAQIGSKNVETSNLAGFVGALTICPVPLLT